MPREWPAKEDLVQYIRESAEHKRVWALVSGLSRALQHEREGNPRVGRDTALVSNYVDRIQDLEAKVIAQKAMLNQLEDCRTFERETERLLIETLKIIDHATSRESAAQQARRALIVNSQRKGPRPAEWGPDSPGYDEMGQ